jgi:hypothetical protein
MGYNGCNINSATESCCKIKWYSCIVYHTGDKYWYLFSMTNRWDQNNQWKSPSFQRLKEVYIHVLISEESFDLFLDIQDIVQT